jgi:DNA adenine methylase
MLETKKNLAVYSGLKVEPRPIVKWVGGKGQLLSQLQPLFPKKFNNYFEPFLGGGAVFFHLRPSQAHLNDLNKKLIGALESIQTDPEGVIKILENLQDEFHSRSPEKQKELFYFLRNKFNFEKNHKLEKAAILIFLNKTCFNGMYRENSKGEFNTPFGSYKNPTILDEENVLAVSDALRNVRLTSLPFENAVEDAKRGDFVYFDPPYHPLTKTANFTGYHENDFREDDQIRLSEMFKKLDKKGCYIMLSNSDTRFIKNLYKGFRIEKVLANRQINCKATGRGKINELVILNY